MSSPPTPQRILIIRPSALGDVCRTVCVLASLRQAYPHATIDWVVQDGFAAAIEAHPALNHVVRFPRARFSNWWRHPKAALELYRWLRELRRSRYDLVLDCQGLGRSGVMTLATGAARRIGLRAAREFAWLGYNQRVPQSSSSPLPPHTVDQMLLLVESLGVEPLRDLRLYVAPQDAAWWAHERGQLGAQPGRYAVIAPTTRWPAKCWPIDRFAQLIAPLYERGLDRIFLIGSPDEAAIVSELEQLAPPAARQHGIVINLAGRTNIGQSMAVIAEAGLVVANDSAPLHLAVGFNRPCVGLYGPTDPAAVGPYRRDDAVVRGYHPGPNEIINYKNPKLGDSLMRFISTAAVLQKIDWVLAHAAAGQEHRAKPHAARVAT